jgi:hypothetical protein
VAHRGRPQRRQIAETEPGKRRAASAPNVGRQSLGQPRRFRSRVRTSETMGARYWMGVYAGFGELWVD